MDMWVVAAAAGAAYIGQHWKNLMRDRPSLSESSCGSSDFVKPESSWQIEDKRCPLRSLAQIKKLGEDISTQEEPFSNGASTAEVPSTSGSDGKKLTILGNHEDWNVLSISCSSPKFLRNEDPQGDPGVISSGIRANSDDLLLEPSTNEIGFSYGYARNRSILRSRRTNLQHIKPRSILQSGLVAQIYKEHAEMKEYILSSISSLSTPTVRPPYFVTDGSRIMGRTSGDFFREQTGMVKNKMYKETYYEGKNDNVLGIPPLPNVTSVGILRETKVKTEKKLDGRLSSSSNMVNGKHISQGSESSHGALFFCLGLSVGIITSYMSNKREVDKLNEVLKQTEILVQDLQEELEMTDSFTIKEIDIDDSQTQATHDYYNKGAQAFSPQHNMDESTRYDRKEFHDQKAESRSKIEAELEAELERLEQNMYSASLDRKLSDLVELDPDFVPDIVRGELRTNMFGKQAAAQPNSDPDASGSSTTNSGNYAVSPKELRIRLHEVLRSRLEERIYELETALRSSQRKVQCMESEW